MSAVTAEQLLNRVNDSIDALQEAQQTVLDAKAAIMAAPAVAAEAKTIAQTAQTTANQAKTIAEAALPLNGSKAMTGSIFFDTDVYEMGGEDQTSLCVATRDKNKKVYGYHGINTLADATVMGFIRVDNKKEDGSLVNTSIAAYVEKDGATYASCPHPRSDNYGNDIATTKAMKDWAPRKSFFYVYVDAVNGSDTADLFTGRGESQEKPFKSLPASIQWINANVASGRGVIIYLMSDVTLEESFHVYSHNVSRIMISSLGDKKTITLKAPIRIVNGCLELDNVNIATSNTPESAVQAVGYYGHAHLILNGVEFSGAVSGVVVDAWYDAYVEVNGNIPGNITGKKYASAFGATIHGASKIPGTEDGTVDANSKAFG